MSLSTLTRLTLVGFSASVLGLLAAFPAGALTTLSQTVSIPDTTTDLKGGPSLTLNKFDAALGTLQEVDFTVNGTLDSYGTIKNLGTTTFTDLTFTLTADKFDLKASTGAPPALFTLKSQNPGGGFAPFWDARIAGLSQTYASIAGGETVNFGTSSNPNTITATQTQNFTGTQLAGFTGPGTFSFNPFTQTGAKYSGTNSSNFAGNLSLTTNANASIQVDYLYNAAAVPFEFSPLQGFALGVPLFFGLRGFKKRLARKSGASKVSVAV